MKTIETDRLTLRGWRRSDLQDLFEYSKNPVIGINAGWKPHETMIESLKMLTAFRKLDEIWAVVLRTTGKVIGSVGTHRDARRKDVDARAIGYAIAEDYWGNGYATEAALAVIKWVFSDTDSVMATIYHYPGNEASRRVILKCGFKYEGLMRCASRLYDGSYRDEASYSLLRSEYLEYVRAPMKGLSGI